MKRNHEDKLIELAFGELPTAEADQVSHHCSSDPEQAKALRAYAELRDGLAGLREVPEMQMSCDRLRDAILAGGLKEPKSNIWAWFAIPTAVAAGAFLFTMFTRQQASLNTGLMAASRIESTQSGPKFDVALNPKPGAGLESIRQESATTPLGNVRFKMPVEPAKVVPAGFRNRSRLARVAPPKADASSRDITATASFSEEAKRMSLGAPPESAKEREDQPAVASVIVISTEQNLDSGTQRATEVESASNVVIGG